MRVVVELCGTNHFGEISWPTVIFTVHKTMMTRLNPLNTKGNLFYIRTQCVPRCKHSPLRLYKTSLLMFYKAKVVVCSEIRTKHINAMWAPRRIF
jgi:hypothetical protein